MAYKNLAFIFIIQNIFWRQWLKDIRTHCHFISPSVAYSFPPWASTPLGKSKPNLSQLMVASWLQEGCLSVLCHSRVQWRRAGTIVRCSPDGFLFDQNWVHRAIPPNREAHTESETQVLLPPWTTQSGHERGRGRTDINSAHTGVEAPFIF